MAHHKSAIKRIKQNEKRRLRNKSAKSQNKTLRKKVEAAISEKKPSDEILGAYKDYVSYLDNISRKGIVHPRNSARKKSRLMKKINALSQVQG